MTIKNAISKFISVVLLSILIALIMKKYETSIVAKINSMPAADYIEHQRKIHHHSVISRFFFWIFLGGFYISSVEFIAYIIGLCFKKKPAV